MKTNLFHKIIFVCLALVAIVACERIPVGYLQVEEGSYSIDSLVVYRQPFPTSRRGMDSAIPWTSLRMEGVAGTKPIIFAFHDVKATHGGDAESFRKLVEQGLFVVQGGGILVLQQKALALLPDGKYLISLKISNEGHTHIKPDVYTIIVKDKEDAPLVDENDDDMDDNIDDGSDGDVDDEIDNDTDSVDGDSGNHTDGDADDNSDNLPDDKTDDGSDDSSPTV